MNEIEKQNKKFYKDTFDNVHASEDLLRKVINMDKMNSIKRKNFTIRKIGYVAAAVFAIAASSNIVTYAATGETWVHKMVSININGKSHDVELNKKTDSNGNDVYEAHISGTDTTADVDLRFYGEAPDDNSDIIIDGNSVTFKSEKDDNTTEELVNIDARIEEKDGKVMLIAGTQTIDITNDIADGTCTGSFKAEDITYTYTASKCDDGSYSLEVSSINTEETTEHISE